MQLSTVVMEKNSSVENGGIPEHFKIVTYELYKIFSTSSEGVHITLMPELRVGECLDFLKQNYSLVDASIVMDIGNHNASKLATMKKIMENGCTAFAHRISGNMVTVSSDGNIITATYPNMLVSEIENSYRNDIIFLNMSNGAYGEGYTFNDDVGIGKYGLGNLYINLIADFHN